MERLVTTNEAAQILGLSLQGVHYRIKKNQLRTKKDNGKIYVYIDEHIKPNLTQQEIKIDKNEHKEYFEKILLTKDEQIELLKATVTWMKKQYKSEIARLENNQKKIIKVFDSEIKLLQSAFNEMRTIYKIENQNLSKKFEEKKEEEIDYPKFLDIKEFYRVMKSYKKSDNEIKLIILDRIRKNDKRFIFNKITKDILIQKSDFLDLV